MTKIRELWRAESATIVGLVLALVNASVISGTVGKILGAVLPILGAGAVRATVWSPDSATQAVTQAATSVASQLTAATVGEAGKVTDSAQAVVDGVVQGALAAH